MVRSADEPAAAIAGTITPMAIIHPEIVM